MLAEEGPSRRAPRWVGALLVLGLVLALAIGVRVGYDHLQDTWGGQTCQATASGRSATFTPEQMANAATIVGIAAKRGLPARAATIAVATAIQESKLRNIEYGDRDSLGLFQQRPSQGWGTAAQVLDPEYATNRFYDALVKIDGYASMEITKVAQEVQRSAYPEAYADHEGEGRILASTISGHSPAALGCRLDPPARPGSASAVVADLERELGVTGTAAGRTVSVRATDAQQAWMVATWAAAKAGTSGATRIETEGKQWDRAMSRGALTWHDGDQATGHTVYITLGA